MLAILKKRAFILALLALFLLRFFHFTEEIDEPHDWRQCDTANYIDNFYKNGIDIFHPTVCWMGARDTVILECPLPEALVAGIYKVTVPSNLVARLVFILIFCIAVFYFYKIINTLLSKGLAEIATLCYLSLPLSIYYSRAIHIDFSVVALTHAMAYYFILGIKNRNWIPIVSSSIFCLFAILIKAPYVLYWVLPLTYILFTEKAVKWFIPYSLLFLVGIVLFYLWQMHVTMINGQSPDLHFILGYRHMTASISWYFGTLAQRLDLYSYWVLLKRGVLEVTGIGGILFFLIGLNQLRKQRSFNIILVWSIATLFTVLLFFNLNLVHNYYQIPLLAPAALICSIGIHQIKSVYAINKWHLLISVIVLNMFYAFNTYYKIPKDEIEIANIIKAKTEKNALVIVTYNTMDCRNPKILYRAKRKGWSVNEMALNATVLERLHLEQQANYWIYIGKYVPKEKIDNYLSRLSLKQTVPLQQQQKYLYIFELK